MQKKIIYFFVFAAWLTTSLAQIKQGDKLFQNGQYKEAIQYYKKDTKAGHPNRQEAFIKLGNCYKSMNDYTNAEKSYESAYAISQEVSPEFHYNYAQILKSKNKYPEAVEQYQIYLKFKPEDETAKKALKFCQEIQSTTNRPIEYAVEGVKLINTSKSEFAPVYLDGKLLFAAERESIDLADNTANNNEAYLNIYIADIDGINASKSKKFTKALKSEFHEGPACISQDGNTLYYNQTVKAKGKKAVYHASLFYITKQGNDWSKPKAFPFNGNTFSVAHPSISDDGKTLFFASDMPGGYGGKDLWSSTIDTSGNWSQPVNLGPDLNTTGDEMFPSVGLKGKLYFSSNGLPGYGGLDIFSAQLQGSKWTLMKHESLNLNSSTDDFGFTQVDDSTGYFSSDRLGGKGKDDIYWFRFTDKSLIVSGTVLLTENLNDFAKQKKVKLLDADGRVIDSTRTNDRGYFEFKNLAADKKYMALIEEDDPELQDKARYYMTNNDSTVQKVTGKYGSSKFAFKNLPVDPNALPDLYTEDDLVFAGNLLFGENPTSAVKNTRLKLVGEHGDVIEEVTTNEFGAFAFRNIPADQNYVVTIEESDIDLPEGTKVVLTNKVGQEIKSYYTGKDKFNFQILTADKTVLKAMEAEDANLVMDLYGTMYDQNKVPIPNLRVQIKDEAGVTLQKLVTTDKGRFSFKNLDVEKNYIFETEENDPALEGITRIYVSDAKGVIYKVLEIFNGKFSFKVVEADKTILGEFVVDDPWLEIAALKNPKQYTTKTPVAVASKKKVAKKVEEVHHEEHPEEESELSITIIQNIYYAYGDYHLDMAAQTIMNKAVEVLLENSNLVMEIKSHTDSQSSAGFNMQLSKKRAQAAVDYLESKGISKKRLKATGYGETRLLNKCADGVGCSDEEHQMNRRTEFKITKPIKH